MFSILGVSVLVCIGSTIAYSGGRRGDKEGLCPPPIYPVTRPNCRDDSDCKGIMKCCGDIPGRTTECRYPIKPGSCPANSPAVDSACVQECRHDFWCPGDLKCCWYYGGCQKLCVKPCE